MTRSGNTQIRSISVCKKLDLKRTAVSNYFYTFPACIFICGKDKIETHHHISEEGIHSKAKHQQQADCSIVLPNNQPFS